MKPYEIFWEPLFTNQPELGTVYRVRINGRVLAACYPDAQTAEAAARRHLHMRAKRYAFKSREGC